MEKFGKNDWMAGEQTGPGGYATLTSDMLAAIAFGELPRYSRISVVGNNPGVATGTVPEDIWTGGGLYPWMTGATSLEVVSSSALDAAAGTGARTVTITGLDINYAEISATVTLNGVTPVAITPQFFRINSANVMTAGTGQVNAGTLTVRNSGAGATRALIEPGFSTARQSQFTVPAGKTLAIVSYLMNITNPSATRDVTLVNYTRTSAGVVRLAVEISIDGNPLIFSLPSPTTIPEKTDYGLRCITASTNNIGISAGYIGILRSNLPV